MDTLSPGTPLQGGKYRIEEPLAQNDACITYLATWVDYNLRVCIKEFFMKDFCQRPSNTTMVNHVDTPFASMHDGKTVQDYQREFLREARTIARLDHPSIIRIHDRFEENNTAYYVMEFVEGPSLADVIHQHGKMEEQKAKAYIRQIGEALHYMHEQGVTHRAVRPSHIMVRSRDQVPILIDFHSAALRSGGGMEAGIEGSASFTPSADVYALAETLEELLTGEIPAMLPDVPEGVIDFLQMSGCIEPPVIEEVPDTYNNAAVLDSGGGLGTEPRIRIHSAADAAAEATREAARRQMAQQAAETPAQPAVSRSYMPNGRKAAPVQVAPAKTAEELQREKYSEVSQQFARNMARNNAGKSGGGLGFGVVLIVVLALIIIGYYLLR